MKKQPKIDFTLFPIEVDLTKLYGAPDPQLLDKGKVITQKLYSKILENYAG